MDEHEIALKASSLTERFADRVPPTTRESISLMDGGGEYGELMSELVASLAVHHTPVTAAERDELLALLEAMEIPVEPIARLNVQG
jgi:hypothetical protein